ncbi:MAG: transglutaminase family protein [bacterium]
MKLKITKESVYTYEGRVSFSPHHARIFPRVDLLVKVDKLHFETQTGADVQFRQDLFGNHIAYCFYPEMSDVLPFQVELELDVTESNPFHFLLEPHGLQVPPQYTADELEILAAYRTPSGAVRLPHPLAPSGPRPTVETLLNFNHWIFDNIEYEVRPVGAPQTPEETLNKSSGSCRDFAALMIEALRQNGVAARLVSGFVWEGDKPDSEKRASSAMHLWVEAFLPGAGWIGIDPTNGVLADHHFIATAVGRRHEDVAPISGAYYSSATVSSTLATSISVEKTA